MEYVLLFIGFIVHLSLKITKVARRHGKNFNITTWFTNPRNLLYIISSLGMAFAILMVVDVSTMELKLGNITIKASEGIALAAGYIPASLFKGIIDSIYKKK